MFLFALLTLVSCKKTKMILDANNELQLKLNDCGGSKNSTNKETNGAICFTKLVAESRCPTGMECIWQGYAACEFFINIDGIKKQFTLSTLKNSAVPWSNETVINGIKISLVDVLPYPDFSKPQPTEPYKAILKIEQ